MKKCTHLIEEFLKRGARCPDCIADDNSKKGNKGHIYKHEDADCEKCGSPWSDTKSICPL